RTKVKVSKISALADDLALALAAPSIRIEAPVPGKGFIGIEVPNTEVTMVALRDVMESQAFTRYRSSLRLGLGKDVSGNPIAADLGAMPHLLIAGTTGSGKSVCVNAIVSCLLLQNTPDDLKFVMVDPKRVELTYFNGIPHLLAPVVVELERVVPALQWVAREMDSRYQQFADEGLRNIDDYNRRMEQSGRKKMHYIVVVIDELADLMMLSPHETEQVITRLAQLARATGIHLVIATQRPSVDVVTGLIKANFPARIAFAVASSVDSRVILDQPGAERLLGRGDMLFQAPDAPAPIRMQGAYVSEGELSRLIRYWKLAGVELDDESEKPASPVETIPEGADLEQGSLWEEAAAQEDLDPIFDEAVQIVREAHKASISMLQRRLRIGYTRAARVVDQMEAMGIIGPAQSGSQPREVLDYGEDLDFSDESRS
ncbi:MAG: DNA translocase FtsK, partial [Anaerolineales bacterium]